jgi:hypothetical protein
VINVADVPKSRAADSRLFGGPLHFGVRNLAGAVICIERGGNVPQVREVVILKTLGYWRPRGRHYSVGAVGNGGRHHGSLLASAFSALRWSACWMPIPLDLPNLICIVAAA